MNTQKITPSEQRNQLKKIETTTRRLLSLFGVNYNNVAPWILDNSCNRSPWQRLHIFGKPNVSGSAILMRLATAGISLDGSAGRANSESAAASNRMAEAARLLGVSAELAAGNRNFARRVNAELAAASDRMAEAVMSLLWLRSQASLAEQSVRPDPVKYPIPQIPRIPRSSISNCCLDCCS
jgi:hypothetical protein